MPFRMDSLKYMGNTGLYKTFAGDLSPERIKRYFNRYLFPYRGAPKYLVDMKAVIPCKIICTN